MQELLLLLWGWGVRGRATAHFNNGLNCSLSASPAKDGDVSRQVSSAAVASQAGVAAAAAVVRKPLRSVGGFVTFAAPAAAGGERCGWQFSRSRGGGRVGCVTNMCVCV